MHLTKAMVALAALSIALSATVAAAHDPVDHALQTVAEPSADAVESVTGTVHEVIVDDTTRGTSRRYVELRLADGVLVPLQGRVADTLTKDSRVEVSGHRHGKPLEVETVRTLNGSDSENKAVTEVDGTLAILHADYFADGQSTFIFEVHHVSGTVRRLRMGSMPAS